MLAPISLPTGSFDEVITGDLLSMVLDWTEITVKVDRSVLLQYGEEAGKELADVVPALCFARVSKTAWSLCSLANIEGGDFDPSSSASNASASRATRSRSIARLIRLAQHSEH